MKGKPNIGEWVIFGLRMSVIDILLMAICFALFAAIGGAATLLGAVAGLRESVEASLEIGALVGSIFAVGGLGLALYYALMAVYIVVMLTLCAAIAGGLRYYFLYNFVRKYDEIMDITITYWIASGLVTGGMVTIFTLGLGLIPYLVLQICIFPLSYISIWMMIKWFFPLFGWKSPVA